MNEIREVRIEDVVVRERKRTLNRAKVEELAASMDINGLLSPILITATGRLVHGEHRLEAARLLGWERMDAVVREMTDLEAELAEIDENLYRSELTVLERGELLLRRDEILKERGLRAVPGDNQHSGGGETVSPPPKTTRELACEIGLGERAAQLYLQIARDLAPEAKEAVRSTSIAQSTRELLRLARIKDGDVQRRVAEKAVSEVLPVASALKLLRQEEQRGAEVREAVTKGQAPAVGILQGDVLAQLRTLPDESIHCVVSSPPYWGLRDYGIWIGGDTQCDHRPAPTPRADRPRSGLTGGLGYVTDAQEVPSGDVCPCGARRDPAIIGLEQSVEDWLARMVEVFGEVRRVLRKDGTCWLNIGDSYAGAKCREAYGDQSEKWKGDHNGQCRAPGGSSAKNLVLQPHRLAIALRADGWIVRSDIIWHKPNVLPQSVGDRPTCAHEHVLLLARQEAYFFDAEAVRENATGRGSGEGEIETEFKPGADRNDDRARPRRNARDVWTIASDPFPGAHFATFPRELVRRCLAAGSSEAGCCPKCGAPWERIVEPTPEYAEILERCRVSGAGAPGRREATLQLGSAFGDKQESVVADYVTVGWQAACECNAGDPIPCTVLDPFSGSGTTCLVAHQLGRSSIGIELNPKYVAMAKRRIFGDAEGEEVR